MAVYSWYFVYNRLSKIIQQILLIVWKCCDISVFQYIYIAMPFEINLISYQYSIYIQVTQAKRAMRVLSFLLICLKHQKVLIKGLKT